MKNLNRVKALSANGLMNEQHTIEWCKEVIGSFSFRKRLLVWDIFEAHMTNEVKVSLKDLKVESALVPGGCTKYIQAPEVYWNKSFKGYTSLKRMMKGSLMAFTIIRRQET